MTAKISTLQFEMKTRLLEKQSIREVWYEQDKADKPQCSNYHSIDRSVVLETTTGNMFKVFWADELGIYHGFGISIAPVSAIERNILENFSKHPHWRPFLNIPIQAAYIHWENMVDNMRQNRVPVCGIGYLRRWDYPQTLELKFDNHLSLFFSALQIEVDNRPTALANQVSIFFSRAQLDAFYSRQRNY